jgi:hypothetical protein
MALRHAWPALAALTGIGCADAGTGTEVLVVSTVTVEPDAVALARRSQVRLTAQAWSASGVPIPDRRVEWSSLDPDIAPITSDGVVSAERRGQTEVVARIDGVSRVVPVHILW